MQSSQFKEIFLPGLTKALGENWKISKIQILLQIKIQLATLMLSIFALFNAHNRPKDGLI